MADQKYSAARVKKLCDAIKMGATVTLACKYAGIHRDTYYEWQKTRAEFTEKLELAEGERAVMWLAQIERAAASGNWQAAAWKLERVMPEDYGRKLLEVSGRNGGPLTAHFVLPDQIDDTARQIQEASEADDADDSNQA